MIDRLDVVADDATQQNPVRPVDETRGTWRQHHLRVGAAIAGLVLAGAAVAITVTAMHPSKSVSVHVSSGGSIAGTGSGSDSAVRASISKAAQPGAPSGGIEETLAVPTSPVKVYIKRITWSEFVHNSGFAGPGFPSEAFGFGYPSADSEVYLILENGRFQQASASGEVNSSWVEMVRLTSPPYHVIAETGWNASALPQWFVSLPDRR